MGYGSQHSLPMSGFLLLFAMILFLSLGFYMLVEDDIGITTTATDGADTWTITKVFLADQETYYLFWIYLGMSVFSLLLFMTTKGMF